MLSVVEGIRVAAIRNGAAPALITSNRSISYSDLLDTIARVSNHLAGRGLKPRAKLFLNIGDPDLRLIVTIAAMHCGFIPFVLLDIGDLGGEVDHDYVIGASVLQIPDLATDLMIDQSVLAGRLSDGTLREFPVRQDDEILFVGSTTGTTGRRKMVAETYGTFRKKALQRELVPGVGDQAKPSWLQVTSQDRCLTTLGDVTYGGASGALQVLAAGATFVRMTRDYLECLKAVNVFGVTLIGTTPGTLGELMDRMDEHHIRCQSVRRLVLVGSLFDAALLRRAEEHFDAAFAVVYGASEVGRISGGVVRSADFRFGYVGELFPEVRLVTSGTREEPAPLVVVRNSDAYIPYYEKGRAVPPTETFFTLPDLGYAEGAKLHLIGRDDEVFNISGNKVAYSTIDAALRAMPGVKDLAVVGASPIGDASGLVIGIVEAGNADLAALLGRVCEIVKAPRVADHVHLFRIDAVPRNHFGKTDRRQLIDAYQRQQNPRAG